MSPRLRNVRFEGEGLVGLAWSPGDKIKLQVAEGVMRSYTPARVDAEAGVMDVVFFVHGEGPGAAWAQHANVGDDAVFVGPKPSMGRAEGPLDWALFLGDETTVGLARALLDALPAETSRLGAIELDSTDGGALGSAGVALEEVYRSQEHGDALAGWLSRQTLPDGKGVVWVSGEVGAAVRLRDALRERGVPRDAVRIKPYWSVKGQAHRKAVEAGLRQRS